MKSLRCVFSSMFWKFGIVIPAFFPSSRRLGPPLSFGRMPLTPPPPTWSIMYCPSVPLELARPPFAESSSSRVFSSVEAARMT